MTDPADTVNAPELETVADGPPTDVAIESLASLLLELADLQQEASQ